jgi:hypothetical protein
VGRDGGSSNVDLPDVLSGIFFAAGLDSQMSDLPVGQNQNAFGYVASSFDTRTRVRSPQDEDLHPRGEERGNAARLEP